MRYSVAARNPAIGSTPEAVAVLWNPHGTKSLYVYLITLEKELGQGPQFGLIRVTTQGTAASTVTPGAPNAFDGKTAPISGCVLGLADFSANPTEQSPNLRNTRPGDVAGGSFVWDYSRRPLEVPAGTGLMIKHLSGTFSNSAATTTWEWEE